MEVCWLCDFILGVVVFCTKLYVYMILVSYSLLVLGCRDGGKTTGKRFDNEVLLV